MGLSFTVPESKRLRVIIDTDAKCEADDQFAIAHALMTPKLDVRGIVAAQFGSQRTTESMEESYQEIVKLLKIMGKEEIPAFRGARGKMASAQDFEFSQGSQFIVKEALREDKKPLFVICLGAITNLACALARTPEIAEKMTVIWIGGGYNLRGIREFNMGNDVVAANTVFASQVPLWQVPMECYTSMRVGFAELTLKVRPCGEIGRYLFDQMMDYNHSPHAWWTNGENWSLGDSPAVGLLLNPHYGCYEETQAPRVDEDLTHHRDTGYRCIRVYKSVDVRFILEDFFAKLRLLYGRNDCPA